MSYYYLRSNPDHLLIFDDSYITLRFASNFLRYKAITYDGSTYLTGATSPLHIILVALFSLFLRPETASLVVGIVFFTLSSLFAYLWTQCIYGGERKVAFLAGVMISTSGFLVYDSLNGLETTMFICFSLLTFYLFYACEHRVYYVFPLLLSVLTRPEGWFIASVLWVWQIVQYSIERDKKVLRHLIVSLTLFIVLISPYLLLCLSYTGSFLPSSAFSKMIFFAEATFPLLVKGKIVKNCFLSFFKGLYPAPLLIFPLMLGARRIITIPYLGMYGGIFYLSYFLFFPGALGHYWFRYQHIFIPLLMIAIAAGAVQLVEKCKSRMLQISVAIVIISALIYNQSISFLKTKNSYNFSVRVNKVILVNITDWLKKNTSQDACIAVHDIGAVGYFSERNIIDLVGLVNPEVRQYYWDTHSKRILGFKERRVIDYLREKKPDYVIMFPEWDRYFNFFQPDNEKHFENIDTSTFLGNYKIFSCKWR
jgi:hypothetical protein